MRVLAAKSYSKGAERILITAERLFGKHGLDGISMRQILIAARHGNKAGVYHHFGNKQGLIQAVFDMRMPELDARRRARLEALDEKGSVGVKELLEALLLPIADIPEAKTRQDCAQFLLQLLQLKDHPVQRWRDRSPAAADIDDRLRRQLPQLPEHVFHARHRLVVGLFLLGIAQPGLDSDSRTRSGRVSHTEDVIAMAAAAFEAPLSGPHLDGNARAQRSLIQRRSAETE
jgi:AcrR family transcriptional regulator